jgi:hypothetical protein
MIRIAGIRVGLKNISTGQTDTGTSLLVIHFCYGIKVERNLENMENLTVYGWGHI